MERICRVCGRPFESLNSRQKDCKRTIQRKCVICGKPFKATCSQNDKVEVCSPECRYALSAKKRKETYAKLTYKCVLCGKEFHPNSNIQKICKEEHFQKCIECGKEFKIDNSTYPDIRKTCSKECEKKHALKVNPLRNPETKQATYEKMKKTMIDRYGVEHPAQNKDILEKMKSTTKERYGVEYFVQSDQYREKAEATNLERYGVKWALQGQEAKDKQRQTNLDRYGVANIMDTDQMRQHYMDDYMERTGYAYPMQNPEVQQRSRETNLKKYGREYFAQTEEFREKFAETSRERYGTDNPMQNDLIQSKVRNTCKERYGSDCYLSSEEGLKHTRERMKELYGVESYSKTASYKERVMKVCTNVEEWVKFTGDCKNYILTHYEGSPTYKQLSHDLGVTPAAVCDFVCTHDARELVTRSMSYMEADLGYFLQSIGVDYIQHDRESIKPLELDFSVPDYQFAIECNPTSTHNCSVPYMSNDEIPIMKFNYHQNKTNMCESKGIFVFHIFGYEWEHKRQIIESMIRNITKKDIRKIYARKCEVNLVTGKESFAFLQANHRQGGATAKVRLGLFYEGELVSLMTFGKMRTSIGTGKEDLSDCWELIRFCSLLNTSVVGGASKLFQYFIRIYNPNRIRSFSDRAHTRGGLYPSLGFTEIRRSDPGYVWVDVATEKAYHRANAQKQNIRNFLKDTSIDLSKTEKEIMIEHGFVQVFDSGTITWEWTAN